MYPFGIIFQVDLFLSKPKEVLHFQLTADLNCLIHTNWGGGTNKNRMTNCGMQQNKPLPKLRGAWKDTRMIACQPL